MSFVTSTHAKSWIFTDDRLADIRQHTLQKTVSALRPGSEPLSLQEIALLLRFYENRIQLVCKQISLPDKCQATAIAFFKRFFLSYTPMEHDAKTVMLTCIYIAGKVEEHRVDMNSFCKLAQVKPKTILDKEMNILEGLHFHLKVYHPYRALQGFCFDLQETHPQIHNESLWASSKDLLDKAMISDLPLLYPPAQLALATLLYTSKKMGVNDQLEEYTKSKFSMQEWYDEMVGSMGNIIDKKLDEAQVEVSKEAMQAADKKLKACMKLNKSKKSKRDGESAADEKRQAKVQRRVEQHVKDHEELTGIRADGSLVKR